MYWRLDGAIVIVAPPIVKNQSMTIYIDSYRVNESLVTISCVYAITYLPLEEGRYALAFETQSVVTITIILFLCQYLVHLSAAIAS